MKIPSPYQAFDKTVMYTAELTVEAYKKGTGKNKDYLTNKFLLTGVTYQLVGLADHYLTVAGLLVVPIYLGSRILTNENKKEYLDEINASE